MNKFLLFSILVLSGAGCYFSGIGFDFNVAEQAVIGIAIFALLLISARRGLHQFFVMSLALLSTAASLGCSFLHYNHNSSGPLAINIVLNPWVIAVFSGIIGILTTLWQDKSRGENRFAAILLTMFAINWVILAFNVRFYDDWKIENWLTIPFIVLIYITHRWFRLSNVSYGLIFLYMMLHIYGSHYTYAEVPFGFWMQQAFDMGRNHYDRIVHFSFGFLLAYPIRELFLRTSETRGFWGFWFPVEFVLAFSCVYELLEWWVAIVFGGDLGVAYLGIQGDVWDAQKDMFNAGMGSVLAMIIVGSIIWFYKQTAFWGEIRDSLSPKHFNKILGERALKEMRISGTGALNSKSPPVH
jgi:putative membrane protein